MTMTEALRMPVKHYIDLADEKSLKMVKAMLEVDQEDDFWDSLPDEVKADVEEARLQLKRGEGIPHAEVFKKYEKWLTK